MVAIESRTASGKIFARPKKTEPVIRSDDAGYTGISAGLCNLAQLIVQIKKKSK
jgi:hypothetical protein